MKILTVEGKSGYTAPGNTEWKPAQANEVVQPEGVLKTWPDGKMTVALGDQGAFAVLPKTQVSLGIVKNDPKSREGNFHLLNGAMLLSLNPASKDSSFKIKVPQGVAGARGTTFVAGETGVTVLEGTVTFVANDGQSTAIPAGQTLTSDGVLKVDSDKLKAYTQEFLALKKADPLLRAGLP